MIFEDRAAAGRALGELLARYKGDDVVVLALPRGGVAVGAEVAKALHAPLDVVVARKVGHPFQPEYAIGAVSDDGFGVFNEEEKSRMNPRWLSKAVAEQVKEARRRRDLYRGDRAPLDLTGKTAILVDDGIATGYTLRAAIHSVQSRHPKRLVVAAPIAPEGTEERLDAGIDELVIAATPEGLRSIGAHYLDFRQFSDEDVVHLMKTQVSR